MVRIASVSLAVLSAVLAGGLAVATECSEMNASNAGLAALIFTGVALYFANIAMRAK